MNPWGTILGVWAHPDDETYVSAAHMMRALGAGDRVVCVTAFVRRARLARRGPLAARRRPGKGPVPGARRSARGPRRHRAPLARLSGRWLRAGPPCRRCGPHSRAAAGGAAGHRHDVRAGRRDRASGPHQRVPLGGCRPDELRRPPAHAALGDRLERMGRRMARSSRTARGVPRQRAGLGPPRRPPLYLRLTPDEVDRKLQALLCQVSQVTPMVDELGIEQYALAIAEEGFR